MNYGVIAISALSLLLSFYTFLNKSSKDSATEMTTVIVKLENIGSGIADIKAEIASLKDDQKNDHDKLIKLEASVATAWKRIDEIFLTIGGNKNDHE